MKYRKKPVVIEAVQWTGLNFEEIKVFVGDALEYQFYDFYKGTGEYKRIISIRIKTLEGKMNCAEGDYIIKGVQGEFYPCKPDIFEATYELVEESSTWLSIV